MTKLLLPLLATALFAGAAHANSQASCEIKSNQGSQVVQIELKQDYRYLKGSQTFTLDQSQLSGSIEILTWEGPAGQASQNTYELAGVKLTNAGMNATVSTDDLSYSVHCTLK